jgi:hypothetical protein
MGRATTLEELAIPESVRIEALADAIRELTGASSTDSATRTPESP